MRHRLSKCISIEDLKDGYTYKILARNATYGIWRASVKSFIISRTKFTMNYIFEEIHWDWNSTFGTAQPLEEIEQSPFNPEDYRESEALKYLNDMTNRLGALDGKDIQALLKEDIDDDVA